MGESGSITSDGLTYAEALNGTNSFGISTTSWECGQALFSGTYTCTIGYMSFDTSSLPGTPDEMYLVSLFANTSGLANSFRFRVAAHDYGPTLEGADWLDPAGLSALTPLIDVIYSDVRSNMFALDVGSFTFGGDIRFVAWVDNQENSSPPNDNSQERILSSGYGSPFLLCKFNATDPGTVGSWASEIAADSPDTWWRLGESSGTTAVDSSGNGNDGTYTNSPTLGVTGLVDGDSDTAITLSNTDNSMVVGSKDYGIDLSGSGMTFEGIYTAPDVTDSVTYFPIVGLEGDPPAAEVDIEVWDTTPDGRSYLGLYYSPNRSFANVIFGFDFPNTRTHIIGTIPGAGGREDMRLYVNGDMYISLDSFPSAPSAGAANLGSPALFYGGGDNFTGDAMTGTLDEAAFYTHVLTPERALVHFKAMTASGSSPSIPEVTSVSPSSSETTGGTTIVIGGAGFVGATGVSFGGTPAASFVVNNDNTIHAVSPTHSAGIVDIRVTGPGGTSSTSSADQVTFVVPSLPTVTYVSPSAISDLGGSNITVVGSGFTGATSVSFGGTPAASFVVNSDTTLHAVAPAHSNATVDLTVTTPNGTSATSSSDQITFATPFAPAPITFSRWIFTDPTNSSTSTFEANPQDGDVVPRARNVVTQSRRAPGDKTVVVVNAQGLREFTFTGTILTQSMYNLLTTWFNKPYPIELTDDLGRTYSLYITKFIPQRIHKPYNPWFHTYTMTGIVVQ
jgi:hypothetical protein